MELQNDLGIAAVINAVAGLRRGSCVYNLRINQEISGNRFACAGGVFGGNNQPLFTVIIGMDGIFQRIVGNTQYPLAVYVQNETVRIGADCDQWYFVMQFRKNRHGGWRDQRHVHTLLVHRQINITAVRLTAGHVAGGVAEDKRQVGNFNGFRHAVITADVVFDAPLVVAERL